MKPVDDEHGYAMLLLIMVLSFSILLGIAALALTSANTKASFNDQQQLQCYYIAATGLEHALARSTVELNNSGNQLFSLTDQEQGNYIPETPFSGGGTYEVEVSKVANTSNQYHFVSTGKLGNLTKSLETIIQFNYSAGRIKPPYTVIRKEKFPIVTPS